MAINNNILYNAAIAGYLGGAMAGRYIVDPTAANYDGIATQATNFAIELDSLIAADATISTASVAIAPTTGVIQEAQLAKTELVRSLSYSLAFNQFSTGATAASFVTAATAIKAVYTQAVTKLVS